MRWFNIGLVVILAAVILIFALQNLQSVTVGFLGFRFTMPLTFLFIAIYLLGMATGSAAWWLVRWAYQVSTEASSSRRP
ncbi:MAG: hypothetical protein M3Y78_01230 [Pseudomonadota bacterium]|nr:hypothetical protein [Pseudomonadota bacterium]